MNQFPPELAPHQIESLFQGKSVFHDNRMKTLKDFTGYDAPPGEDGTLGADLVRTQRRVTELEALNESLRDQLGQKPAEAEPSDHADLIEALIPDSKTGLERLPVEAIQAVAKYRGLDSEGKDKAALVAALLEGK